MSRFVIAALLFISSTAELTNCGDFAGAEAMEQLSDEDEDEVLEVSLLQTSLKLSQRLLTPSSNTSAPERAASKPRESLISSALLMTSLNYTAHRTKDIIALPGACVLGVAFAITLIFVALLWAVMMEASNVSKAMASSPHEKHLEPASHGSVKDGIAANESDSKLPAARSSLRAPPICPALILPHGAAQFSIPMESMTRLRAGQYPMQILGPSGRPLLHAWLPVCMPPDAQSGGLAKVGHQLQLTTTSTSRHPHASIGPLPFVDHAPSSSLLPYPGISQAKTGKVPIEIFGPYNTRYGTLTRSFDKWHIYYRAADGPENLVLTLHSNTGFPSFAAYAPDGQQVASAMQYSSAPDSNIDMLTISVSQGSDALLTLLSILAVVLSSMERVEPRSSASLAKEQASVETETAQGADEVDAIPGYPEHVSTIGSRVGSMSTLGAPVQAKPTRIAQPN